MWLSLHSDSGYLTVASLTGIHLLQIPRSSGIRMHPDVFNPARLYTVHKSKGILKTGDYSLHLDGPRLASPALGPLGVSHSRVHLHRPDHQAPYYPCISSRPQRYPILRSSLPAIDDTVERIRDLESAVWQVDRIPRWFC